MITKKNLPLSIFFFSTFLQASFGLVTFNVTNSNTTAVDCDFPSLDSALWNVSNYLDDREIVITLNSSNLVFSINNNVSLTGCEIIIKYDLKFFLTLIIFFF